MEVQLRTEIVDADLPLLLGNSTLKKGLRVLHFGKSKLELLDKTLNLKQTKSGHYSMAIHASEGKRERVEVIFVWP